MSIQTFSKSFLFPNNKRKLKTKSSYSYWAGPLEPSGPRPHLACSDRAKGVRRPGSGLWPTATWPSSAEAKGVHAGVETSRRRGSASGPAAIAGRVRASGRARGVHKEVANPSRQLERVEEGKEDAFHGGRARRRHDGRRRSSQNALPWLKRRHSREHQVLESEAELGVLDCGQWWSMGGEFHRRGLRWRSVAREQSSRGRNREAVRESEEWSAAGSADEGGRLEAEAGHGCRATGIAGTWSPRGGLALTRSGRDARERRGAAWSRPDAALGWARHGAGERRAR